MICSYCGSDIATVIRILNIARTQHLPGLVARGEPSCRATDRISRHATEPLEHVVVPQVKEQRIFVDESHPEQRFAEVDFLSDC